jgi:hypothetical protein
MGVSAPRSLPSSMYLKGYTGIASWIAFYTSGRLHQAFVHRTPVAVWREGVAGALGAQVQKVAVGVAVVVMVIPIVAAVVVL